MIKKVLGVLFLLFPAVASAANYMQPAELKQLLQSKKQVLVLDVQTGVEFEKQHLPGSIETNAFPAKTEEEKKRLDRFIPVLRGSKELVVIICPRGKSAAMNSYEYLLSRGISEDRLRILEGGIGGWPYREMLVKGR